MIVHAKHSDTLNFWTVLSVRVEKLHFHIFLSVDVLKLTGSVFTAEGCNLGNTHNL